MRFHINPAGIRREIACEFDQETAGAACASFLQKTAVAAKDPGGRVRFAARRADAGAKQAGAGTRPRRIRSRERARAGDSGVDFNAGCRRRPDAGFLECD